MKDMIEVKKSWWKDFPRGLKLGMIFSGIYVILLFIVSIIVFLLYNGAFKSIRASSINYAIFNVLIASVHYPAYQLVKILHLNFLQIYSLDIVSIILNVIIYFMIGVLILKFNNMLKEKRLFKSYPLIGGLIFSVLMLIIIIFTIYLDMSQNLGGGFGVSIFFLLPGMILTREGGFEGIFVNIIISLIFYFILGAVIGWLYGKTILILKNFNIK